MVAALSRVVSALVALASIPLVLHTVGTTEFGVWATLSSLSLLLAFSDLGLGNGLIHELSAANARDDRERAASVVSTTFFLLCVVSLLVAACFIIANHTVSWGAALGVDESAVGDIDVAVEVFAVGFIGAIPLAIGQRVNMALQESAQAYMWIAAGSVIGLGLLILFLGAGLGLPGAVAATVGGPFIAAVGSSLVVFGFRKPWLSPDLRRVDRSVARDVAGTGGLFFISQVGAVVAYQSDIIVVAGVLGAASVTELAVPLRLFAFVPVLVSLAVMPYWPAYRDAAIKGDAAWARRTLIRTLSISAVLVSVSVVFLVLAGPQLIDWWSQGKVSPSTGLLLALGAWAFAAAMAYPLHYFTAGAGAIRFFAATTLALGGVNVALSIPMAKAFGVEGVVWATVISQVLCAILPFGLYAPRRLKQIAARQHVPESPAVIQA